MDRPPDRRAHDDSIYRGSIASRCKNGIYLSVYLFLMNGHSFERIWTKFGLLHLYTLRVVMGRLASAARACRLALLVPSIDAAPLGN